MALLPGFDLNNADGPHHTSPVSVESVSTSETTACVDLEIPFSAPASLEIRLAGATQALLSAFTAYSTAHQTLHESLKIVATFAGVEYCYMLEATTKNGPLVPLRPAYTHFPDALAEQTELENARPNFDPDRPTTQAFLQKRPVYINAEDPATKAIRGRYQQVVFRNGLALPVSIENEVRGVFCLWNKFDGDFDARNVAALESLTGLLGILLKNVQLANRFEHQNRRHLAVVDAAIDGFIEVNPEMEITLFSKGAENLTGWQASEVLGRHCYNVLMPHSPQNEALCNNCPLRRSFRYGISVSNVETLIRNRDGEDNWASCSYNSVTDERGQVTSGIIAIKDIYRLKALSDELRQQSQQQESLLGVNNAINGLSNIEEIFRVSLDSISRSIDFDLGTIHSLDPDTNELKVAGPT